MFCLFVNDDDIIQILIIKKKITFSTNMLGFALAKSSSLGAIILQGPHHVAKKSTTTN